MTRILGGSRTQSEQIRWTLGNVIVAGHGGCESDSSAISRLHKSQARVS
jgi:hypothetical protein